ncbi:interferon regulatory factor 9 [Eublepharis macularius]|uniref:Interferon regulatory factor 9 n=1 Tax=Eublepharis macularius TaxID=481883 RepID=A0AA97LDA9_EUBMA|nr:interferon regulatory factor 9 [Eublepharis macularius]XP_054851659.1 interferon regulatory factor 9 [Eublepharis macularius]
MATPGRGVRSTRKLRQWTVEQVESGKFPGLVWDDPPAKTMFRIPWKHAGKQEFRSDEDAGFFKAWAIFKGKYRPGERLDPATWKTRVRCALSKSPEFEEVPSRSKMDITEPYKVYRLVPLSEQCIENSSQKSKKRKLKSSRGSTEEGGGSPPESAPRILSSFSLLIMDGSSTSEATASPSLNTDAAVSFQQEEFSPQPGEPAPDLTEITLSFKAKTVPTEMPLAVIPDDYSIQLSICYCGVLVQSFWLPQGDFLITSVATPPGVPINMMRRMVLPHPNRLEDPQKQKAILQLLKDLENGVMADSNREGIFIQYKRKCKASVSWQGLTESQTSGKLDNGVFLQVFSTKVFQSAWNLYLQGLAPKPEHQVTLCIGDKLDGNDSLDTKLIVIQMVQTCASRMSEIKEIPDPDSFLASFAFPHLSA